jgi:hypothetical protein
MEKTYDKTNGIELSPIQLLIITSEKPVIQIIGLFLELLMI